MIVFPNTLIGWFVPMVITLSAAALTLWILLFLIPKWQENPKCKKYYDKDIKRKK